MKKITLAILLLVQFSPISDAGILDKKTTLYLPNHKKARVQVSFLTGKVTHIWERNYWVPLEVNPNAQRFYQNLYEKQKDRKKKKKGEK